MSDLGVVAQAANPGGSHRDDVRQTHEVGENVPASIATAQTESAAPKVFDESYVKQLRGEAAAARVRLKEFEAADAARRADDEARKLAETSELDRLKIQVADAENRARGLEVQTIRTRAAARHSLPEELHEFITADDEAGALAQAEKLAARLKPSQGLPQSGGRNPANSGEQARKQDEQERFSDLKGRVPQLNNRMLRG